jgi:hypothetical protein
MLSRFLRCMTVGGRACVCVRGKVSPLFLCLFYYILELFRQCSVLLHFIIVNILYENNIILSKYEFYFFLLLGNRGFPHDWLVLSEFVIISAINFWWHLLENIILYFILYWWFKIIRNYILSFILSRDGVSYPL